MLYKTFIISTAFRFFDHLCRYRFPVDLLIWLCRTYCIQHQLYQLFYRPDFDTIPIASVAFIHCYGVSVKALLPNSALNLSNSIGLKLVICLVLNKTFRKCNDKLPSFNTLPSCSACIQCYRMDYGMDQKIACLQINFCRQAIFIFSIKILSIWKTSIHLLIRRLVPVSA